MIPATAAGELVLVLIVSACVALLTPLIIRPVLRRYGVVDVPNARSSHVAATLRAGGVAQLLSIVTGLVLVVSLGIIQFDTWRASVVLGCGVAASAIGLTDDLVDLGAKLRIGLQLLVGFFSALFLSSGGQIPAWSLILASGFIGAHISFTNFMDGINGVSGLHGVVVGGSFIATGSVANSVWIVVIGLILGVAYGAFLVWNLTPPGMFLGDVGSYLLGAVTAGVTVAAVFDGISIVAIGAPLTIYIADTTSAIGRRVLRREPILEAHRTHAYQRLVDSGLSHIKVAGIIAAFTAVCGVVGILSLTGIIPNPMAVLLLVAIAVVYLALPVMKGFRFVAPFNKASQ